MWIRNLVEDLRDDQQPGEKPLFPNEMAHLFRGRYAFTNKILGISYEPVTDLDLPDDVFFKLQVERRRIDGKSVFSKELCATNKPDHRLVQQLNEPDILLRASNTEKMARKVKLGLGFAAVGAAFMCAKGTKAYKSRKHNQI